MRLLLLLLLQAQDMQLQYPVQDPQSKAFYDQAAVAAASMGIVVDVYAAARGYVGLQTLEPLVNSTGGALYLYPSAEEATLPQDLYRWGGRTVLYTSLVALSACVPCPLRGSNNGSRHDGASPISLTGLVAAACFVAVVQAAVHIQGPVRHAAPADLPTGTAVGLGSCSTEPHTCICTQARL